ncbi:MAG TPA: hypothetical protein VNG53_04740 [Bacteroidia bacterium]|nr:hypothetical protein [Bacteroidia bacterium]
MVHKFKKLTPEELDLLLNATIFVSLLAASSDSEIFEEEKADAIKLAHLRTFTSDPALHEYYKEVEKTFAEKIEDFDKKLPKGSEERGIILREKLNHINKILPKLGEDYAEAFHRSLNSYARHVSVSHRNAVEFFFIPMNIDGITNQRKKNN